MRSVSITHAKNHLSELIAKVRRGQSVLITDRNQPVARLEPVQSGDESQGQALARLERAGVVRRGKGKLPEDFWDRPRPRCNPPESALDALIEERSEGR